MSHASYLVVALLASSLAACGGKSSAAAPNGGEEPNAGSGQGGSSSGAPHGGSASNGGTRNSAGSAAGGTSAVGGNAGTSGAAACQALDDEAGLLVNVTILNKTMAPIYIGQSMLTCGVSPLFQVADIGGTALPSLGNCRSSCVTLRREGAGGCPAICLFPSSIALQPGEIFNTTWDGLYLNRGKLSKQCVPYDTGRDDNVECDQAKRIEPGTFSFSAQAGSALDCSQTSGDGCAPCKAQGDGGCAVPSSLVAGKMLLATTIVTLDGTYGVYPQLPSNPSNGAGDAAGNVPGGAALLRSVDLVFTE